MRYMVVDNGRQYLKVAIFNQLASGRFELESVDVIKMTTESYNVLKVELSKIIDISKEIDKVVYLPRKNVTLEPELLEVEMDLGDPREIAKKEMKKNEEYISKVILQEYSNEDERPTQKIEFIESKLGMEIYKEVSKMFRSLDIKDIAIVDRFLCYREAVPRYGNYIVMDFGMDISYATLFRNRKLEDMIVSNTGMRDLYRETKSNKDIDSTICELSISEISGKVAFKNLLRQSIADILEKSNLPGGSCEVIFVGGVAEKDLYKLDTMDTGNRVLEDLKNWTNEFDIPYKLKNMIMPCYMALEHCTAENNSVTGENSIVKFRKYNNILKLASFALVVVTVLNILVSIYFTGIIEDKSSEIRTTNNVSTINAQIDEVKAGIESIMAGENRNVRSEILITDVLNSINMYKGDRIEVIKVNRLGASKYGVEILTENLTQVTNLTSDLENDIFRSVTMSPKQELDGDMFTVRLECVR